MQYELSMTESNIDTTNSVGPYTICINCHISRHNTDLTLVFAQLLCPLSSVLLFNVYNNFPLEIHQKSKQTASNKDDKNRFISFRLPRKETPDFLRINEQTQQY